MKTNELLGEFRSSFSQMRSELGFHVTLSELDDVFFLEDVVLQLGFVPPKLSRMLAGRIRDTFNGWIGALHGWLLPNPSSLIALSESDAFSEDDKTEMKHVIRDLMAYTNQNNLVGLTKDSIAEGKYFDDALVLWNTHRTTLIRLQQQVCEYWKRTDQE